MVTAPPAAWVLQEDPIEEFSDMEGVERDCDTGTSGQRWSDCNIELVRFLGSHEGDGTHAVFASVQLLYKNNFPNDPPSKFAHH